MPEKMRMLSGATSMRGQKRNRDNSSILTSGKADSRGTNAERFGIWCLDAICSHPIASIFSLKYEQGHQLRMNTGEETGF